MGSETVKEAASTSKEKSKTTELASFLGKSIGIDDEPLDIVELNTVSPDTKAIKKETSQGINPTYDQADDLVKGFTSNLEESIEPKAEEKKDRNRAKSMERTVGFTEVGEISSEMKDDRPLQASVIVKKEQTKITERAKSVEKNVGIEENIEEADTFNTAPQEGK